jgi:hypothetical protein
VHRLSSRDSGGNQHLLNALQLVQLALKRVRRRSNAACRSEPYLYERRPGLLLHHCLHDRILEIGIEFAIGVIGLHHENANYFPLRIPPKNVPKAPSQP